MRVLVFSTVLLITNLAFAGEGHPKVQLPVEIERMKQLSGKWEGKTITAGKEEFIRAHYEIVSGGTAVMERLGVGKPNEMVTMYHASKKKLALTHYCALGNQPTMLLKQVTPEAFIFEMKGSTGLQSMKEPHMHALTITFHGPNQITQEWVYYENGKKRESHAFFLKRQKPPVLTRPIKPAK